MTAVKIQNMKGVTKAYHFLQQYDKIYEINHSTSIIIMLIFINIHEKIEFDDSFPRFIIIPYFSPINMQNAFIMQY